MNLVLDPRKGVAVVLLALLLWLGWSCATLPPPLLGVLRPVAFGVGVLCDPIFLYLSYHVFFARAFALSSSFHNRYCCFIAPFSL